MPFEFAGSFAEASEGERLANFSAERINRSGARERAEMQAIIIFFAAAVSNFAEADNISAILRRDET